MLTWRRVLRDGVILYVAAVVLRLTVMDIYSVPSGSMRPTLIEGDHLLVNRLAYGVAVSPRDLGFAGGPTLAWRWRAPVRGDVVVFRHPRNPAQIMVKRVVGLPGDRIAVTAPQLTLNGGPVPRRSVEAESGGLWSECLTPAVCYLIRDGVPAAAADILVAADHLFVLGDDRPGSSDSRSGWQVPIGHVLGRVDLVAWSIDPAMAEGLSDWLGQWRWARIGLWLRSESP